MDGLENVSADQPYPLTKQEIKTYWEDGYLVIKKLYDLHTLNLFRNRFKEICNDYEEARKHVSIIKDPVLFKKNVDPEMFINKIQELLHDDLYKKYPEDPKMLRIVSQLIGDDLTAVNCMLINKPPGTCRHPPHQDLYYFPFRPSHKIAAAWTAIDRVYPGNGCLYVVPGSHRKEILYPHGDVSTTDKKQFYHGLIDEEMIAPKESHVHLEMDPGDTVFFHPYLVHGSGANTSLEYRKAITAHFANSIGCYYIDIKGTVHEPIAKAMEYELKRRGAELSFADIWRIKSKQVKGIRSNL